MHIIVVVSVGVEGVNGLVLGYFFGRCTAGERCLLRAQYQVAFVGWRVKESLIVSA